MAYSQTELERDQILFGDLSNFSRLAGVANPTQDEVRLHAGAVRRLLLDGVLPATAGSRQLPVAFHVPDSLPLVRAARNGYLTGFNLAGVEVFGVEIAGAAISIVPVAAAQDFDPSPTLPLKLDSFLKQIVAFSAGQFLSRHDVILYVANKIGGVHFDLKPTKALPQAKIRALGRLRKNFCIGINEGITQLKFTSEADEDQSDRFRYEPQFIDAVYLEFLACIGFVLSSPEIQSLKNEISLDLRSR